MSELEIRSACAADAALILELIRALATFERAADAVKATEADLLRDGFGERPHFEAILAFVEGRAAGLALFFTNYSTWEGRAGLYLEDLFVHEWARRHGVGRALVAELAAMALARGYQRLDLAVLDWNPARGFYDRLGFEQRREWLPYRVTGAALRTLAARRGRSS